MGTLKLQSDQIQAVGYVQGNVLQCTAFGRHNIYLGEPTFVTPLGSKVWSAHELPTLPGSSFLILAPRARGYVVIILPKTFLDVFTDDAHMSLGLYSLSAQRVIVSRGKWEPQWLERLGNAQQVQFVDKDNFVVIRRSGKFEFASYVAVPVVKVDEGLYRMAAILVPVGVLSRHPAGAGRAASGTAATVEAVWKRIFADSAIGTPLHSRSLNGVAYFLGTWRHSRRFGAQSVPLCS